MKQENNSFGDLPLGLSMALARNPAALQTFVHLPEERRRAVLAQARAVKSKAEMQNLVHALAQRADLPQTNG